MKFSDEYAFDTETGLRADSPAEESGELFAIPDESCCSAEFGCILKDTDGDDF